MIAKENPGAQDDPQENPEEAADREDNSLANKLSEELSNWRRQRNISKPRRPENDASPLNTPSEPARTIRVRGHETLVVRKPKLASKTPSSSASESE